MLTKRNGASTDENDFSLKASTGRHFHGAKVKRTKLKQKKYRVFQQVTESFVFWSLGIGLYLELFCFLSFISFVLRNLT